MVLESVFIMKPCDKAWELLEKFNGKPIKPENWGRASKYYKDELKKKVHIVIQEVIATEMLIDEDVYVNSVAYLEFWRDVEQCLNAL